MGYCVCVCGHIYRRHAHSRPGREGCEEQVSHGSHRNVPVRQGPLGHAPSGHPGRNPAGQGQRLPLPQHSPDWIEATSSPARRRGWHPQLGNAGLVLPPHSLLRLPEGPMQERGPRRRAASCPQHPGSSTSDSRAGLTSWRMSSSLGMMESSRVSSLQRQGRGSGQAEATGSGRTGILVARAPPGPRGWGE